MTEDMYSDIPYLQDLRRELVRAATRANHRRRRKTAAARTAAVLVAAVAAALVGLTVLGGGRGGGDSADAAVLRRVAAALAPPAGTILHERALVRVEGQAAAARYELWQEADAPFAYRVIKFGHEASWNGSGLETYDAASNTIVTMTGSPSSHPDYTADDMAADLRALVRSGQAKVERETTFAGVPAYELAVTGAPSRFLNGTVYVAKSDYHPLEIRTTLTGHDGECPCAREVIDFQVYQYLPANDANRALIDVHAQHPDARVVTSSTETTTTGG